MWSVGCATGEEVIQSAMMIDDCIHRAGGRQGFGMTGTDISLPSLHHARDGDVSESSGLVIFGKLSAEYCQDGLEKPFPD